MFQVCSCIIMDPPTNQKELKLTIERYLKSTVDGELTRGNLLANKQATKTKPKFHEYLKGVYGERWTTSLLNPVYSAVSRIEKYVGDKAKNLYRSDSAGGEIVEYLNVKYTLPLSQNNTSNNEFLDSPEKPPANSNGLSSTPISRKRPLPCVETPDPSAPETPPATPNGPQSNYSFITPKRSKVCSECHVLRHESSDLRKELYTVRSEAEKLRIKVKQRPSVLGQTIKRLEARLETQKLMHDASKAKARTDAKTLRTLYNQEKSRARQVEPLLKKISDLKSEVNKLKREKSEMKRYRKLKKENSSPSDQLKAANDEIKILKERLGYSENRVEELECDKENIIPTMDGNQFDVKTRKSIQFCLSKNVPQHHAGAVVNFVMREMTGNVMQKVPKRSSVQNMAHEMSIISNIQTGEIMVESDNVTLGSDSTTKSGIKVNETHLMTRYGPKVLDISESPGATAKDQAMTTRDHLSDMINQYSEYANKNPEETSKRIHDGNYNFYFHYMFFFFLQNIQVQTDFILNMSKITRLTCCVLSVRKRKER